MSLAIGKADPIVRRRALRMPRGPRRLLVPLLIVLAWQAASSAGFIGTRSVPSPVQIGDAFRELMLSGEVLANLLASLGRVAIGLGIGVAVGPLAALVAGTPKPIAHAIAAHTASQVGTHRGGSFSFQPLWDSITASDPDLFD